jgi:hypothetical protein
VEVGDLGGLDLGLHGPDLGLQGWVVHGWNLERVPPVRMALALAGGGWRLLFFVMVRGGVAASLSVVCGGRSWRCAGDHGFLQR